MKNILLLLLLLLITPSIFANDGRIVLGSTVEMIDNEETNITMLEEEIIITLHSGYYEVDVSFVFFNEGPEETILLGFPVKAITADSPKEREAAKITNFQSYINNELIADYIIKEESIKDFYLQYTQWFIREVTFPEKDFIYSRVTYKAPYNMEGYFKTAGYIYETGQNWKGTIGKMTVIINHSDNVIIGDISGDVLFGYFGNYRTFDFSFISNGTYKYILENIEPKEKEQIKIYVRSITRHNTRGDYYNPFDITYEGWVWDEKLLYKDLTDIKLLTRNQIHLFINYFYAIHGYEFKNPLYHQYFQRISSFDNKSTKYWINPNFSEDNFNYFKKENIKYLRNLLNMIPSEENSVSIDQFLESIMPPEQNNEYKESDNDELDELDEQSEKTNSKRKIYFIIGIIEIIVILAIIRFFILRKK